jgi:hypothetical protein
MLIKLVTTRCIVDDRTRKRALHVSSSHDAYLDWHCCRDFYHFTALDLGCKPPSQPQLFVTHAHLRNICSNTCATNRTTLSSDANHNGNYDYYGDRDEYHIGNGYSERNVIANDHTYYSNFMWLCVSSWHPDDLIGYDKFSSAKHPYVNR